MQFLEEKLRLIGTAACLPYHSAIVIGVMSAEFALKTAKYASAKYLDALPTAGDITAHGFRDVELEAEVLELTRQSASARSSAAVILPRRAGGPAASARSVLPGRDRGVVLGRPAGARQITPEGVFLERPERDPARFLPEVTARSTRLDRRGRPRRPQLTDGRYPGRAVEISGEDAIVAVRPARRGPEHRARQDRRAARRRRRVPAVPV